MHMWCFIASRRNFTCWRKQNGPEQHTNQHFFPAQRVCSIDEAWVQRGANTVQARGEEQVSDHARAVLSLECPQHASRSPGLQSAPPQVIANRPPSHLHLPLRKTILIPPFRYSPAQKKLQPPPHRLLHQLSLLKKKRDTRLWSNKRQLLLLRLIMESLGLEQSPPSLIRLVSIYWMLKQRATFL